MAQPDAIAAEDRPPEEQPFDQAAFDAAFADASPFIIDADAIAEGDVAVEDDDISAGSSIGDGPPAESSFEDADVNDDSIEGRHSL